MNNLFQNNYESENDRKLDKKFSYNYQVIKNMYPKASELPEDEVRGIIRKYYQAPKGQEEQAIKDYIRQKEPEWQQLYGLDDEDKEEAENANSFWSSSDKMNIHFNKIDNLSKRKIKPVLRAEFNGEKFTVVDEDNNVYGSFRAQSGFPQFQYKGATNVADKGPIPEGKWLLKYSDIEDFKMPYDENPSFLNSWGRRRIKLTPLLSPEKRFGRDGFYLHGSYNGLGSAGCIDLGLEMPGFSRIIDAYGDDIPVTVKYKSDSW